MTIEAPIAPPPVASIRHRHSRRKRRLPLWITIVLGIVVGTLAVVAVARIVAWDSLDIFAILNSVTAFVYLPAWIVAVVAALGRRYLLAGAALVVVGAQIAFMIPELTAAQPLPGWAATAPTIRVFDANVYDQNPSMAGYASQIKEYRPQLLTMEEAVPSDVTQLKRDGALAGLPYSVEIRRNDPFAFLIASKYPLTGVSVSYLYDQPLIVKMAVQLPSGSQTLWAVHTTGPVPQSFTIWKGQLAEIDRQLRRRGPADLLLVGDFNATWNNLGFRQILDAGMTDGAAARARPFEMTWSQIKPILPPVVRIDHVLTGPGVAVTAISTNEGPGSDHRDVQATVAFRR
jgi:endonuclease/exonuclease/phosphatase (EEP) superfamily protein YafD